MRTTNVLVLAIGLFLLAALPWLVRYTAPRPLVPPELGEERAQYQTAVAGTQEAELAESRNQNSNVRILPGATLVSGPGNLTATVEPVNSPEITPTTRITATETAPVETMAPTMDNVSTPLSATILSQSIVTISTVTPQGTPAPTETPDSRGLPPTPTGMIDQEDLITDNMIAEQMTQDAGEFLLRDLDVTLTPDGVGASGQIVLDSGISRQLTMTGVFAVEKRALVVDITSILLDGVDTTERYRNQFESKITTSLYRLLPERYVQSFELADGYVLVYSKVRP